MTIKFYVFILTDSCGNKYCRVFEDPYSIIYMHGYEDDGTCHAFDDEARHAYTWAKTYGFKLECVEKEIEI